MASASMQGYLTKRGRLVKSWLRRWFVLEDGALSYFVDKDAKKAKGTLSIAGALMISQVSEDTFKRANVILVRTSAGEDLYFQADGTADASAWFAALTKSAALAVSHSGALSAQAGFRKKWKERYYILSGPQLSWFDSEASARAPGGSRALGSALLFAPGSEGTVRLASSDPTSAPGVDAETAARVLVVTPAAGGNRGGEDGEGGPSDSSTKAGPSAAFLLLAATDADAATWLEKLTSACSGARAPEAAAESAEEAESESTESSSVTSPLPGVKENEASTTNESSAPSAMDVDTLRESIRMEERAALMAALKIEQEAERAKLAKEAEDAKAAVEAAHERAAQAEREKAAVMSALILQQAAGDAAVRSMGASGDPSGTGTAALVGAKPPKPGRPQGYATAAVPSPRAALAAAEVVPEPAMRVEAARQLFAGGAGLGSRRGSRDHYSDAKAEIEAQRAAQGRTEYEGWGLTGRRGDRRGGDEEDDMDLLEAGKVKGASDAFLSPTKSVPLLPKATPRRGAHGSVQSMKSDEELVRDTQSEDGTGDNEAVEAYTAVDVQHGGPVHAPEEEFMPRQGVMLPGQVSDAEVVQSAQSSRAIVDHVGAEAGSGSSIASPRAPIDRQAVQPSELVVDDHHGEATKPAHLSASAHSDSNSGSKPTEVGPSHAGHAIPEVATARQPPMPDRSVGEVNTVGSHSIHRPSTVGAHDTAVHEVDVSSVEPVPRDYGIAPVLDGCDDGQGLWREEPDGAERVAMRSRIAEFLIRRTPAAAQGGISSPAAQYIMSRLAPDAEQSLYDAAQGDVQAYKDAATLKTRLKQAIAAKSSGGKTENGSAEAMQPHAAGPIDSGSSSTDAAPGLAVPSSHSAAPALHSADAVAGTGNALHNSAVGQTGDENVEPTVARKKAHAPAPQHAEVTSQLGQEEEMQVQVQQEEEGQLEEGERRGRGRRGRPADVDRSASVMKKRASGADTMASPVTPARARRVRSPEPVEETSSGHVGSVPHPGTAPIRHYPAQAEVGGLHIKLVLENRPEEAPYLPTLNKWQNRCCAGCGVTQTTGMFGTKARFCWYTELLFCPACMGGGDGEGTSAGRGCMRPLPWRIVHTLDDTPFPVCRAAADFIDSVWDLPLVALTAVAPDTFIKSPSLQRISVLRVGIFDLRETIIRAAAALPQESAASASDSSDEQSRGADLLPSEAAASKVAQLIATRRLAAVAVALMKTLLQSALGKNLAFLGDNLELLPLSLIVPAASSQGGSRIVSRLTDATRRLQTVASALEDGSMGAEDLIRIATEGGVDVRSILGSNGGVASASEKSSARQTSSTNAKATGRPQADKAGRR